MEQDSRGPNLLVVTVDRFPAWILPAYGSTWVSMPALDGLAARGVVFDRLIATGDEPATLLADLLGPAAAAVGGAIGIVTDEATVAAAVPAGWASVRHVAARATADVETDELQTSLARLFAAAAEVVAAGEHRLVWCHAASLGVAWDAPQVLRDAYIDPDDPPPPAGAAVPDVVVTADTDPDLVVGIRQNFAGQLTLLDRCLGRLLDATQPDGPGSGNWAVLVAGVRGIPLGLHGRVGTGPLPPYGELVHVPAILADARGRMAAQRYGGLVTPADVGATLRDMVDPEAAAALHEGQPSARGTGHSLAGLFATWTVAPRDRVIVRGSCGLAVVTPEWHLVVPAGQGTVAAAGQSRLFHKPDDYFELCDVADRCPDVAEDLRAALQADDGPGAA